MSIRIESLVMWSRRGHILHYAKRKWFGLYDFGLDTFHFAKRIKLFHTISVEIHFTLCKNALIRFISMGTCFTICKKVIIWTIRSGLWHFFLHFENLFLLYDFDWDTFTICKNRIYSLYTISTETHFTFCKNSLIHSIRSRRGHILHHEPFSTYSKYSDDKFDEKKSKYRNWLILFIQNKNIMAKWEIAQEQFRLLPQFFQISAESVSIWKKGLNNVEKQDTCK